MIRIVVRYPPDLVTRAMLPKLTAALGQSIVVEKLGEAEDAISCGMHSV